MTANKVSHVVLQRTHTQKSNSDGKLLRNKTFFAACCCHGNRTFALPRRFCKCAPDDASLLINEMRTFRVNVIIIKTIELIVKRNVFVNFFIFNFFIFSRDSLTSIDGLWP